MQNKRNEELLKDCIYLTVSLLHATLLEYSFVHPTILKSSGNKCAIFTDKLRHHQRHKLAREPANLSGSRVEFQEKGNRFSTSVECSLNFQSASYLDRQCMHCGRMNQCYVRGSQWG